MTYRDFAPPRGANDQETVGFWMDWMRDQGDILIPVAPRQRLSCASCFGAVKYADDGETWPTCWDCSHRYDGAVDTFVPITYSLDAGLESMLHPYKDRGVTWLRRPLASLLSAFVRSHADCIDDDAGGIDVATIVPSDNQTRAFNHLSQLIVGAIADDPVNHRFDWDLDVVTRDRTTRRPGRGEFKPEAYTVEPDAVDGKAVLLLDDTWTSGSSAASTAGALKEAGAAHVTVLTLGRQLNLATGFGSTTAIYEDRRAEPWVRHDCVLCT